MPRHTLKRKASGLPDMFKTKDVSIKKPPERKYKVEKAGIQTKESEEVNELREHVNRFLKERKSDMKHKRAKRIE